MQIHDQFRASIQPDSYQALTRLLGYRNESVIRRCIEDNGMSEAEADTAWVAFLQFMAVCMFKSGRVSSTPSADHIWHSFLLHTQKYAEFCDEYMRGFVHHEPATDYLSPDDYQESRAFAERIFININPEIWPKTIGRIKCLSMAIDTQARYN